MTQFKKGLFTRNLMATAILAPMMIVAGCSDNDGSPLPSGSPSGVASGFAYDGYLQNALVCVDVNLNRACDEGEPDDTTDAEGNFDIVGLTDEQLNFPLVLESTPETIDLDTGAAVGVGLKFTAPGGSQSINGFTTIIQSKVEAAIAAGETGTLAELRDRAAAELARELDLASVGLGEVNLLTFDPIASKNDTSLDNSIRRAIAQLHLTNQVLSEQIMTLTPQVDDSAAAFGALIKELDAADVFTATVASTPGSSISLNDLLGSSTDVVVGETEPTAPTAEEIQAQEDQDATVLTELEDAASTDEPVEPTGATGATGA